MALETIVVWQSKFFVRYLTRSAVFEQSLFVGWIRFFLLRMSAKTAGIYFNRFRRQNNNICSKSLTYQDTGACPGSWGSDSQGLCQVLANYKYIRWNLTYLFFININPVCNWYGYVSICHFFIWDIFLFKFPDICTQYGF